MMSKGPERKFRIGLVSATVWVNHTGSEGEDGREFRSVTAARNYRDASGQWQSAPSFSLAELPAAIAVLQLAYAHVAEREAIRGTAAEDT